MKTVSCVICLILLTEPLFALDLTVRRAAPANLSSDVQVTYWQNKDSKVYIRLPRGWKESSSQQAVIFQPLATQSEVKVRCVCDGGKGAGGVNSATPARQLQLPMPPGATDVTLVAETIDPLPIFNWTGREATYEYNFYGTVFMRSLMELRISETEQLQVTVVALAKDFEVVHAQAFSIFQSWFEPAKDLPPERAQMVGAPGGA